MNIKEELMIDLKDAMKTRNQKKKDTITMIRAAILQVEKDTQKELDDNGLIEVISRESKKRKEAKKEYAAAGRDDIVADLDEEISVLEKYLPKQLTKEEVMELTKKAIAETGATNAREMGMVMKYLKPLTVGKVDGKILSDCVRELLS